MIGWGYSQTMRIIKVILGKKGKRYSPKSL